MQIFQLCLIFILLVGLTYFVIKILGILIPFALWLVGFIVIAALIAIFTALFYNKIQDYFKNQQS